ncbi:MAG: ComEC/Rec2 family competence protein [Candidatus Nanopelagicus sp.]
MWIKQVTLENGYLISNFNTTVCIEGVIRTDPVLKSGKINGSNRLKDEFSFLLNTTKINTNRLSLPIRVKIPQNNNLIIDQKIQFTARIIKTRERKVAALAIANNPIYILNPSRNLFDVTEKIRSQFRDLSNGTKSSQLVPGLVLGDTSLQSEEFQEQMRKVGLSHLTAVSGANFVLVASFLLWFLQFFVRRLRQRIILVLIILFLFIFLVRPTPSVLRAAVMTLVILLARIRGERSLGVPSLGAAITLLILLDPFQSIDPGFALSVLATAGILLLSPRFEKRFELGFKPKFLLQAVSIPISATLFCLPVIILLSNEISSATIPSNILVAPVIAPITILGFISALITPLFSDIGQVFFNIASFFANIIVLTSDLMMEFPSLYFPNTKVALLGILILLIIIFMGKRMLTTLLLIMIFLQAVVTTYSWPGKGWQIVNCDVGQGDGLVVNLGRNSAIVIDTGPDSKAIDQCLRSLKISDIPLLILTHFHADHVGAIPSVIANRRIGEIWISNLYEPVEAYKEVMKQLSGMKVKSVFAGDRYFFESNNTNIQVLWPQRQVNEFNKLPGDGSRVNNSSISVLIKNNDISLFSGGDIEPEVQEAIYKSGLLTQVDVLKVSHHGSAYQYLPMLEMLNPKVAIISVGKGNSYGHPNGKFINELAHRGAKVWRTDQSGGISVISTNKIRVVGKEWWKIRWG